MNSKIAYQNIVVKNGRFPINPDFVLRHTSVVVTAGPGNCLLLFRMLEWEPIREKLLCYPMLDQPNSHTEVSLLRRLLLGYAREVQISGRGILGLDEDLIDYARIQGRLLWVPGQRGIELWSPSIFDEAKRSNILEHRLS